MSKKRLFLNGKTIFGAVIVALLIVVVTVLIVMNHPTYNDDYFVSDGTKIVLSMDVDSSAYEYSEYQPPITHVVYYYSGDSITGVKVFFEYDSNEVAKKANENISMDDKSWAADKAINDRYIIFSMKKEEFDGLTTEQIRDSVEAINSVNPFNREEAKYRGYHGE